MFSFRPSFRPSAWAVALTLLAAAAGCKVDAQKCDQACRNAASLLYWKTADREIAAAPADQRDALRKQKLGELARKVEEGIDGCVLRCQSARNEDDANCLIAAQTAEQVQACSQ
ncbi:MAG TPA: hypothetical protein VHW23_17780 [Kofleriaceae bacterium]|jgi:hypothetical protein|nr:hypothetical protein [Kofleriaceae bacterium]